MISCPSGGSNNYPSIKGSYCFCSSCKYEYEFNYKTGELNGVKFKKPVPNDWFANVEKI